MMKKLLLCSNNCQDDENDNEEDSDDADVIVEPQQEKSHSLSSFCNQVESLENLNFNYEVIVKFVKQGNNPTSLSTQLQLNGLRETDRDWQSLQTDLYWNARLHAELWLVSQSVSQSVTVQSPSFPPALVTKLSQPPLQLSD